MLRRNVRHEYETYNMRCFVMLVTAVCMLFLLKLKWPKNKNFFTLTCCMQTKNRKSLMETVNNEQLLPDLKLKSGIPTGTNSDNSLKVPLKSMYMVC